MDPLWAQLLNSDWHDHVGSGRREDRIDNDAWLARFLAVVGWTERHLPSTGQRVELRRLRAVLRHAVDDLRRGRELSPRDLAALNRRLAACPTVQRLETVQGRVMLVAHRAGGGIEQVLATVAASFADMLADGDPGRIKICANPDCGWVIYDESRNRTRRWCEASVCGSLVKVRRLRASRRAAPGPTRA